MSTYLDQDIQYLLKFPDVDIYSLDEQDLTEQKKLLETQQMIYGTLKVGQPLEQENARLRSYRYFSLKRDDWIQENKLAKAAQLSVYGALKEEFDKR